LLKDIGKQEEYKLALTNRKSFWERRPWINNGKR
jgi:hypothetical protein